MAPVVLFLLVFAPSVPFWLIGAATGWQPLPGLPASSLMFVCPAMVVAILVHEEKGPAGVVDLLRRSFDHRRIEAKAWYVPILLLMPGLTALAYWLMRLTGSPLPSPQLPGLAVPAVFLAFFVAGLGEELGWSGYATDRMQERWGALGAGVLLGLAWTTWHLVPLSQAGRSLGWTAW